MKPELGYLDRNGKFYACHAWGHVELAHKLDRGGEKALEAKGWMTLKGDPPIGVFRWFYLAERPPYPSNAQWNYVFDWCIKKKITFPPNYIDFVWEDHQNDDI